MRRAMLLTSLCLLRSCLALGQQAPPFAISGSKLAPQLSFGYLYEGSRTVPDDHAFGLNGGRVDVMLPLTRHAGVAAEFSGVHTRNMAGSGVSVTTLTYLAGPRLLLPIGPARESTAFASFVQTLFGGVHAIDGVFPNAAGLQGAASAVALSAGGGLQMSVNRKLSLRLIQADYLYTRLPNLYSNYQSSYRIGAGIVLALH